MTSLFAGMVSAYFAVRAWTHNPGYYPHFDCRVFNVPDKQTALSALIWRQDDAVKNSVSMLAQAYFSHKELHGKSARDKHDMLHAIGVNWNECPTHFKSGAFFRRETFDVEGAVRSRIGEVVMPRLRRVENLVEVVYEGAEPILRPPQSREVSI